MLLFFSCCSLPFLNCRTISRLTSLGLVSLYRLRLLGRSKYDDFHKEILQYLLQLRSSASSCERRLYNGEDTHVPVYCFVPHDAFYYALPVSGSFETWRPAADHRMQLILDNVGYASLYRYYFFRCVFDFKQFRVPQGHRFTLWASLKTDIQAKIMDGLRRGLHVMGTRVADLVYSSISRVRLRELPSLMFLPTLMQMRTGFSSCHSRR